MALLGWLISLAARVALRREWAHLRVELLHLHTLHLCHPSSTPAIVAQALLITAEDHRFFKHRGVDPIAVGRAAWRRLATDKREGASTIEMQLVRVLTGRFERTAKRKLREIGLATLVHSAVPRTDIPALYLRVAYYGTGMTGFTEACRRLGVPAATLSVRQAASVIARLKYPQPLDVSESAQDKVRRRTAHLVRLYDRHALRGLHQGLRTELTHAAI
jgi:penicillin-binding protein 1A